MVLNELWACQPTETKVQHKKKKIEDHDEAEVAASPRNELAHGRAGGPHDEDQAKDDLIFVVWFNWLHFGKNTESADVTFNWIYWRGKIFNCICPMVN